jgi:hypothetical protein
VVSCFISISKCPSSTFKVLSLSTPQQVHRKCCLQPEHVSLFESWQLVIPNLPVQAWLVLHSCELWDCYPHNSHNSHIAQGHAYNPELTPHLTYTRSHPWLRGVPCWQPCPTCMLVCLVVNSIFHSICVCKFKYNSKSFCESTRTLRVVICLANVRGWDLEI